MATYSRNLTLGCFFLVMIIISTVLSAECDRPAQFTNRAILDRYLRCLKSKIGPRYGKRMSYPTVDKLWPNWLASGKTENSFNSLYGQPQYFEN